MEKYHGRIPTVSKPNGAVLLVEIKFRHLLSTGKTVAIEDAAKSVVLPEGFDKRAFGGIPRAMAKAGEIVEAGYRRGTSSRCNKAVKRLWVATDKLAAKPRGERSRD
jgi:hypothetical protein